MTWMTQMAAASRRRIPSLKTATTTVAGNELEFKFQKDCIAVRSTIVNALRWRRRRKRTVHVSLQTLFPHVDDPDNICKAASLVPLSDNSCWLSGLNLCGVSMQWDQNNNQNWFVHLVVKKMGQLKENNCVQHSYVHIYSYTSVQNHNTT